MAFLPAAVSALEDRNEAASTLFTESVVRNILDLLANAIDTNKANQDFILSNFKIYETIEMVINQN